MLNATVKEMVSKALKMAGELEYDYDVFGIRFESKEREIGEICEESKSNHDREDERSFPEYDSEEYEELETMGGTSAWSFEEMKRIMNRHGDNACKYQFLGSEHCYLVAADYTNNPELVDDGEIVIIDAKVIYKFW